MYAIYGNIYHQYTPFMLAYIPYMDPMGYIYIYIYSYPLFLVTMSNSLTRRHQPFCGRGLKIREVKRDRMQRAFGGTSQTLKTVNIQIDPGQAPENAGKRWKLRVFLTAIVWRYRSCMEWSVRCHEWYIYIYIFIFIFILCIIMHV